MHSRTHPCFLKHVVNEREREMMGEVEKKGIECDDGRPGLYKFLWCGAPSDSCQRCGRLRERIVGMENGGEVS